ncbi:MAG TPA: YcxB family protein [Blastocatellia bacterium]|nr:YcxB family protein [Blastocatellia bacterium]
MNLTLDFEYTFEDYLEASKAHGKRRPWLTLSWYFIAAVFTLAAGVTAVAAIQREGTSVSVVEVLVPAFFLFVTSPFFFRLMARQRWKQQPQLQARINYEITPDLVRVATKAATSEMKWASFIRLVETKNVFLLYPNKLIFHIIPKRAFADSDELASFRELATSRIPPSKGSYLPWR